MIFKVKQPGIEDMHCFHDAATASGTDFVVCEAGVVVGITGSELVAPVQDSDEPYGFLMQRVKKDYADLGLPVGFRFRGDHGSSDAFVGDAVGVMVGACIAETDQYAADSGGVITAGEKLYAKAGGVLTNDSALSVVADTPVAVAKISLSAAQIAAGVWLRFKSLL